jgi:hypothetical protein
MIGFDAFTVGAKRAMQSNNKRATRLSELVALPIVGRLYGMAVSRKKMSWAFIGQTPTSA